MFALLSYISLPDSLPQACRKLSKALRFLPVAVSRSASLSQACNTEAVEQLNRWFSRTKLFMNHLGFAKGKFFGQELREMHNERSLHADCMNVVFMPAARLAEVRAAYGLPAERADGDSERAREELANLLLGLERAWRPDLLSAHRQKVGGAWRDVIEKGKAEKRKRGAGE